MSDKSKPERFEILFDGVVDSSKLSPEQLAFKEEADKAAEKFGARMWINVAVVPGKEPDTAGVYTNIGSVMTGIEPVFMIQIAKQLIEIGVALGLKGDLLLLQEREDEKKEGHA